MIVVAGIKLMEAEIQMATLSQLSGMPPITDGRIEYKTQHIRGREYAYLDDDGKMQSVTIGFANEVFRDLELPLDAMDKTARHHRDLIREHLDLQRKNKILQINNAAQAETIKSFHNMSFRARVRFALTGRL